MANPNPIDPFDSTEEAVEVDSETSAAIEEGLVDSKEGRVTSGEKVRGLVSKWISSFSTQKEH